MNTINSLGQTLTMEGLGRSYNFSTSASSASHDSRRNESPVKLVTTPTGSEVAQDLEKNAQQIRSDAIELQKMSDMVMGRKVQFNVNKELDSVVVKVIDASTNQVIKEIPSEDIQKLKVNIRKAIGLLFDDLA